MEHYVIGQPIENDLLIDVIFNLYDNSKIFPKQKIEIYYKIYRLSNYLNKDNDELDSIVKEVKEKVNEDKKGSFFSNAKTESNIEIDNNESEDKTIERREVNRIYFNQTIATIESMYKEIGENATDSDKLAWIYKYVFEIPFDHSNSSEDIATRYKSTSKALSRRKAENSFANAGAFKNLCDFACLSDTYCTIVSGMHNNSKYFWNAVLTPKGVFYCDASAAWNGEDSFDKQFMLTPKELKTKVKGYSGYSKTECVYVPRKQ